MELSTPTSGNHTIVDFAVGAYGPTIFIALLNREGVMRLFELMRNVAETKARRDLAAMPGVKVIGLNELELTGIDGQQSKSVIRISDHPARFRWTGSPEAWKRRTQLLEPFLQGQNGHQFMSDEHDDALIEVSFGERHGLALGELRADIP